MANPDADEDREPAFAGQVHGPSRPGRGEDHDRPRRCGRIGSDEDGLRAARLDGMPAASWKRRVGVLEHAAQRLAEWVLAQLCAGRSVECANWELDAVPAA